MDTLACNVFARYILYMSSTSYRPWCVPRPSFLVLVAHFLNQNVNMIKKLIKNKRDM